MDDKKIRAFLTIIQLGSLRRAAQELNYTQSGLTQMMKHLEQEVGCRLLRRSHSGVTMTESAEHLLPYFQAADQALLQLRHESEQFSGPQRKTIVIGAFPSIAKRWLPQRIQRFRLLHPEIQLDLRLGGDEVADWAAQRSVDLALADEVLRGSCEWIPLLSDPLLAVFPRGGAPHPDARIDAELLGRCPFIMPDSRDLRAHIQPWGRSQLRQTVSISSDDDSALLSLVRQGLGVTILPEMSLETADSGVSVRPLLPPMQRTVGILLPRRTTALARRFAEFLQKSVSTQYLLENPTEKPSLFSGIFSSSKTVSQRSRRRSGAKKIQSVFLRRRVRRKKHSARRECRRPAYGGARRETQRNFLYQKGHRLF